MSYSRHYDVPLLDDLHNYLPEILYGQPEQFGGAAPLVSYVQQQMQRRFDLFSAGRRSFAPTTTVVSTPPRLPQVQRIRMEDLTYLANLIAPISDAQLINNAVMNTFMQQPAQIMMEPVVVRPTREQIAAGTSIEIIDAEEDVCTICQDAMPAGSEARALRCDHRFHPGCIDTWFQRSVACPTCRHDIREPVIN
jgi:hypothetical protein